MAENSSIEWTDATWNPTTGCTKISPGCAACYIDRTPPFRMAGRKFVKGRIPIEFHPDRLEKPLHWRKPRRVFVNSLSDLFHPDIPFEFIDRVFAVMALADWHVFQVLTKRPERLAEYVNGRAYGRWCDIARQIECGTSARNNGYPLRNVWLGTSVENQAAADERIPHLLNVPAAVRFISGEPLLGPVNFEYPSDTCHCGDAVEGHGSWSGHSAVPMMTSYLWEGIDWVIVGSESGPKARAMNEDWVRSLRDQCSAAGVAFFYKQRLEGGKKVGTPFLDGRQWMEFPYVNNNV